MRILLCASFVASAAFATVVSARTVITDPGTELARDSVRCGSTTGEVVVSTAVRCEKRGVVVVNGREEERVAPYRDSFFHIAYVGPHACTWIQFTRVTVRTENANGDFRLRPARGKSTHGDWTATTDMRRPVWHVDSGSDSSPLYSASFAHTNPGDLLDAPTAWQVPGEPFTREVDVAKVVVTLLLEAYLVCDKRVCHKVLWSITHEWNRDSGWSRPRRKLEASRATDDIDAAQRAALERRYSPSGNWIEWRQP